MVVQTQVQDHVMVLTITHKRRTNPWDMSVIQSLVQALAEVNAAQDINAVLITGGARRGFSVGGDLDELQRLVQSNQLQDWVDLKNQLFNLLFSINKPIVAAMDRYCIGLGFVVSLIFDWRIATDKTVFSLPEIPNGVEGSIVVEFVSAVTQLNTARRLLYRTEPLQAAEIHQMNLIDEVVPADQLLESGLAMAKTLGAYPAETFASTKETINKRLRLAHQRAQEKDFAFITESRLFNTFTEA